MTSHRPLYVLLAAALATAAFGAATNGEAQVSVSIPTGVGGTTYISPSWGYAFTWDPRAWRPTGERYAWDGDNAGRFAPVDELRLEGDAGRVVVQGFRDASPASSDPEICRDDNARAFLDPADWRTGDGVGWHGPPGRAAAPALGRPGYPLTIDEETTALGIYPFIDRPDVVPPAVPPTPWLALIGCRLLLPGEAVLVFRFEAEEWRFVAGLDDVDPVIWSIALPWETVTPASRPTASPTAEVVAFDPGAGQIGDGHGAARPGRFPVQRMNHRVSSSASAATRRRYGASASVTSKQTWPSRVSPGSNGSAGNGRGSGPQALAAGSGDDDTGR
jgi:hypothetical protein